MMSESYAHTIGAASKQTGCSVPTIRYYEEIGLLPTAPRSEGNQRHYNAVAIRRLSFIRQCRDFGFTINEIRELVSLVDHPERDCVEVRDIAQLRLEDVRRRMAELRSLEANLAQFVKSCNSACAGGSAVDCTILEDLARPVEPSKAMRKRSCCS